MVYWSIKNKFIDELNQCKSTMRLLRPGESFQSSIREGNVVSANEIQGLILDHEVNHRQ